MNKTAIEMKETGKPPRCPYCGDISVCRNSTFVYGNKKNLIPGKVFVCINYPECAAYVGTHNSGPYAEFPLGRLADAQLREAKKMAHRIFDGLWQKEKLMTRKEAYAWMQRIMRLSPRDAHIGEMTFEQCMTLYEKVNLYLTANLNDK